MANRISANPRPVASEPRGVREAEAWPYNDEVKTLMIDVVNHSYAFLSILFCTDNGNKLIELLNEKDEIPEWNDPEISGELIENAKRVLKLIELRRNAARYQFRL